ncbi:hypothetical protein MYU51_012951 [Penicillium brevicompactum]
MGRSRVRSFISSWGKSDSSKESRKSSSNVTPVNGTPADTPPRWQTPPPETPSPPTELSPVSAGPREGNGSRPASMSFSRNPPLMQQAGDTPPELSPIFSFLNIHTNKVYQEGYFLKLNDLDTHGRACGDRQWLECYAQLVGTVLSLWDSAALDAAGGGEVPATFINLADASLKMIETLPIQNGAVQPLKNVLSLSSAGKNRYLLHFNSFHSLIQWTAAIRLAMYEHTSLYEAYTGSLVAAKGKYLNGINSILAPTKFRYEDWARVRFGAGTPWRRCWFVISPPDEKELQKARKLMKKSAYDRLSIPVTGNIKFYETKKTKKAIPIATVTQVFSTHAIYPQSKALIEASTLVKMEGRITTHMPESSSEGIVFIMPEPHAGVSGFEMMLRFLFPTFDTFNLYGRPTRLVADTNHIKSIMFAFPKERRYGYLDVLDIANLLQTPGSQEWNEAQWRKQLKEATQRRISSGRSRSDSVNSARPRYRSMSGRNSDVPIDPARRPFAGIESKPQFSNSAEAIIHEVPRNDGSPLAYHNRVVSDTTGFNSRPKYGNGIPAEDSPGSSSQDLAHRGAPAVAPIAESSDSESDPSLENVQGPPVQEHLPPRTPPAPVSNPPDFSHGPKEMPAIRPQASSEQRLANNRMSHGTLSQLTSVGTMGLGAAAAGAAWKRQQQQQQQEANNDQKPQGRSINGVYYGPGTSSNSETNSSSDEGVALALPVRPPTVPEHRPNTPSSSGSLSAQQIRERNSPQQPSPQRMGMDPVKSVRRKPLPQRDLFGSPGEHDEPSYDDLRHTLDEDVLNSIAPHASSLPSPISPNRNDDESVYDNASTVSPDYASTHESVYSKKSVASTKPRMGVKKTVGVPATKDLVIGDAHYTMDKPPTSNPDIPNVDFGPTMTYMPTTGRPNTSDTLRNHQRKDSAGTKLSIPTHQMDQANARPSSQEEYRRSVLWQPGMASGRPVTPGGGLTPEQYVQQRAAPSPQMQLHNRTPSNPMTVQRPVSGDWAHQARAHSPMNAPRPSSRGAQSMLNHNDHSSHLSAREQEHVARMTGSSFFNMSNDNRKSQTQVNPMGLVSAIDAREREKREMREGMSNQMVQQAIAQRQHSMGYQQAMMHQQSWSPQQFSPQQAASVYPPQQGHQESMYNMPAANHTWDALNQPTRPDEPRRSSWYGQLSQAPQTPQTPPSYQASQTHAPDSRYYNYAQ